jgi:hypothetical protein
MQSDCHDGAMQCRKSHLIMLAQASLQVSRLVKPPTDVRSIVHTQLPQQAKLLPAGKLAAQLLQSFQHQQHPHVGHRLMMFNSCVSIVAPLNASSCRQL